MNMGKMSKQIYSTLNSQ